MLKENWRLISRIERFGDLVITILAFYAAYFIRKFSFIIDQQYNIGLPFQNQQIGSIDQYYTVLIIALIAVSVLLTLQGGYGSMRLTSIWQLLKLFFVTSFLVFITIAAVLFMIKAPFSRSFIALFCLLLGFLLTLERIAILKFLRFWRRKGYNYRNIVICGLNQQALRLAKKIQERPELGIRIRCYVTLEERSEQDLQEFKTELEKLGCNSKVRIIQKLDGLQTILKEYAIDELIVTDIAKATEDIEQAMLSCSVQGVRTTIAADLFSIGLAKSDVSYFDSIPLIHFQPPPGDRWELNVKRLIDIFVSLTLILLLFPVFILIALLVKLTSKGPIFFIQKRVGRNGHLFNMYKFRSMQIDAEAELDLLKSKNEMEGPAFKLKSDPRVTKLGHFLRKHSLDELPQLWNVLTGEMSLVGPRPPLPNEVSTYERYYRRRLSMRPGLTCTWQVSGRNEIKDFADWVKLDLEYIDNWSLSRDISLLFKTIPAIILGTGG